MEAGDEEEPAQPVLTGRTEYGIATSDLVLHRNKGNPVVAPASIFRHSPWLLSDHAGQGSRMSRTWRASVS